ncbi:MAG: nuclease superfamily, partial [Bacteroidota bacterium]
QVYDTKSEYQSEKKFYDILMLKNDLADKRVVHEFLFEFKYAKNATEARLGKIDEAAVAQVNDYLSHKQLQNHPNLRAWRIVIVGDTLEICEQVERKYLNSN